MTHDPNIEAGTVADAVDGNWVDTKAPDRAKPYLRLSRADRPIGTWLLFLPCLWGVLLASAATGRLGFGTVWIILACAVGAFLMRGAGCTWNDITDRSIDAQVARTRSRPLPSGQVTVHQAFYWMATQAAVAFVFLLTLSWSAIGLGILSLALVAAYPFAKRFTWWPQAFLGLAFNWGVLVAWAAHGGGWSLAPILLYLSGIAWTLFYDTIYAHQDTEDDALIGVKSTALLFKDRSKTWLIGFAVGSTMLMGLAVLVATQGSAQWFGLFGVLAFGGHLAKQLMRFDPNNDIGLIELFRSNRDAGLWVALFFAFAAMLSIATASGGA